MASTPPSGSDSARSSTVPDNETFVSIEKDTADPFLVKFAEGDPANPKNWPKRKKWYLTFAGALLVLNATFASSAPSSIIPELTKQFNLSREVSILVISLFVAGYCVGPLLWGPLSEEYGRRPIFIISFFIYMLFQIGVALSQNAATLIILRFLGGTFAAAPLANSGALIADIWDARERGTALAIFTLAPFAGPALGPTVAGFMSVAGVSWRWVFWVMSIFAAVCWIQIVVSVPETYEPILLRRVAEQKRKETGDSRYYAPIEKKKVSWGERLEGILARPFKMMFQESMIFALGLYMSFVYGCIYLLFESYPIVFTRGHHFNAGISGLMFLPLPIGGALAVLGYIYIANPRYERLIVRFAPQPVPPEYRLEIALVASPVLAVSFFWFAWTSFPSISFWAPMSAGVPMGFAICWIFLTLFNYIIDAYLFYAASALAAVTIMRSLFGAAFPLFAIQMYEKLGARWATSLLGFVSVAMIPIPIILMKYGPKLREKSKYAPTRNDAQPKKMEDSAA